MGSAPVEGIEVEDRHLAWRTLGEGLPLLLINGYAATGEDWDPTFLAALAESFEVICPDNRGVGASELGELVAAAQAQLSPRTLRAQGAAMASWHRAEQLHPASEPPPTLIAHGDLDAVSPPPTPLPSRAAGLVPRLRSSPALRMPSWPKSPNVSPT